VIFSWVSGQSPRSQVRRLPRNRAYFELMSDYNRTVPRVDDTVKHRCRGLQAGHGLYRGGTLPPNAGYAQPYEQPACLIMNWAVGDLSVVLPSFSLSSLSCHCRRSSAVLFPSTPFLTYVRTVYVRFVTTMTSSPPEGEGSCCTATASLTLHPA
jgi:hypothetical protein